MSAMRDLMSSACMWVRMATPSKLSKRGMTTSPEPESCEAGPWIAVARWESWTIRKTVAEGLRYVFMNVAACLLSTMK
ncbi:hypothetical protein BJQ90_02345 [Arthrobacter sp. SO3]|nr:hypothetical protein [Arthrobacter sp. SO3]